MSANKAGEIIRRAMADRSVYDAMAVRENEVWGKILRDREQSEPATEDIKGGTALGICRNQSSLFRVANEKGLKFEHGLTLGCGTGRCERDLIAKALFEVLMLLDRLCIEEKIVQPVGGQYRLYQQVQYLCDPE
jgi:hypothetical protein